MRLAQPRPPGASRRRMAALPPLPELCFAEIPATSRHRYVGDRFCYMEAGRVDLPPVLLLHGIGANSLHWRYQLAGLSDRFRLIAWNAKCRRYAMLVLATPFKTL